MLNKNNLNITNKFYISVNHKIKLDLTIKK